MIQEWRELIRRWKQFLAALFSIRVEDLAESRGREVTRLTEEHVCPLLSMAAVIARRVTDVTMPCLRDGCQWWQELPLPVGANGEYRIVRDCTFKLIAMFLHSVSLAVWDRRP